MNLAKLTKMARERFHAIKAEHPLDGVLVPLTCYITPIDYIEAAADAELLSWLEHMVLNCLFAEMAERAGAMVVLVPIFSHDYHIWRRRHKLENTTTARAKYAAQVALGKTENHDAKKN